MFGHFSTSSMKGLIVLYSFFLKKFTCIIGSENNYESLDNEIKFKQNSWNSTGLCWYAGNPAGNCLFKVSYGNIGTMCQVCSKLTIKTPDAMTSRRRHVVLINKLEQILYILLFLILFDFPQVYASWEFDIFLFFIFH